MADATLFRDLFAGCYERWEIAGSLRRNKPDIGDCEHVVIPKFAEIPNPASMFGEPIMTNLLWARLNQLIAKGELSKHVYPVQRADGSVSERTMFGEKYRGVNFRVHLHEIFTASRDNFGAILAIRTGSGEFSKSLVTRLLASGRLRQVNGYLTYADGTIYPCRDEQVFFAACGVPYMEPAERTDEAARRLMRA
jgi:DNA polymerase/3'-5' exonuclease PolX